MVEQVEDFGAELHIKPLVDRNLLKQREVHIGDPWPSESIASQGSVRTRSGFREGTFESCESIILKLLVSERLAVPEAWGIGAITPNAVPIIVSVCADREGKTRLKAEVGVHLPATQNFAGETILVFHPGQIPGGGCDQAMGNVKQGVAMLEEEAIWIHRIASFTKWVAVRGAARTSQCMPRRAVVQGV